MSSLDTWRRAKEVDIAALCTLLGLPVNTQLNPVRVKCPFHNDGGDFNLTIHTTSNKWHGQHVYCYACEYKGSAIDLVRDFLSVSDREAVEYILGHKMPEVKSYREEYVARDMTSAFADANLRLFGPHGEEARAYLERRGIDAGGIGQFMLGLWRTDSSKWSGRITIPHLRGPGQDIIAGKARTMLPVSDDNPKYLATRGAAQSLYLLDLMPGDAEQVVLVEGEVDAISLSLGLRGVYPVVGIPGVHNFKDASPFTGRVVYVVLDNDEAGRKARDGYWRERGGERIWTPGIVERLTAVNAYPFVINPQMGDINEMLVAYGPDGLGQWFIEQADQVACV